MDPKNTKFRFSNVSLGQKGGDGHVPQARNKSNSKNFMSPQMSDVFDDNQGIVDF